MKKKVDFTSKPVILGTMNYAQEQLEYLEWKAQHEQVRRTHPCDITEGGYALVDDESPTESPIYFLSLDGAVDYAENSYPYSKGKWSVYKIGNKVM